MKYLSLDLETTGLNPKDCQILQLAAIVEDTKQPLSFNACPKLNIFWYHDPIIGEPEAIEMNAELIGNINKKYRERSEDTFSSSIYFYRALDNFILINFERTWINKVILAGKNIGTFDLQFLKQDAYFTGSQFHHRVLDPAMLYTNFNNDEYIPNTLECLQRAKIETHGMAHDALNDAWNVIRLLREKY